jgi:hypothetical protein
VAVTTRCSKPCRTRTSWRCCSRNSASRDANLREARHCRGASRNVHA